MDGRELDHVGWIMARWREQRPDLDPSPQGIIGRLHRLAAILTGQLEKVYREFGLSEGEFDVLATLRRSGPPYSLTPREIGEQTMITSGAVTKRVDRIVEHGLASRRVSERDGRGRVVTLTPEGVELIDACFTAHMANEHRLVELLGEIDRARLARLLETWSRALEETAD